MQAVREREFSQTLRAKAQTQVDGDNLLQKMRALSELDTDGLVKSIKDGGFLCRFDEPGTMVVVPANHLLLMTDISDDTAGSCGIRRGLTGWDGCLAKVMLAMNDLCAAYPDALTSSTRLRAWKELLDKMADTWLSDAATLQQQ